MNKWHYIKLTEGIWGFTETISCQDPTTIKWQSWSLNRVCLVLSLCSNLRFMDYLVRAQRASVIIGNHRSNGEDTFQQRPTTKVQFDL